jgi:hypothetical protein
MDACLRPKEDSILEGSFPDEEVAMKKATGWIIVAGLVLCVCQTGPALGQDPARTDLGRILGTWTLEVYVAGQTILLTLLLEKTEAGIGGKLSEQMGMFTDAPVKSVKYEGTDLTFEITVTSPPDGLERTWLAQFSVGEDAVEGTISNDELAISAPVAGKREKRGGP